MPTSTLTKFETFALACLQKKHNLGSDQIKVAFCNAANAPSASGDAVLADLVEVSYTNCSSRNVTTTSLAQTGGTAKLVLADLTITASGGAIAAFRYVVFYNDTATNDELIGYIDYGADITIADGGTLLIDCSAASGVLTAS